MNWKEEEIEFTGWANGGAASRRRLLFWGHCGNMGA